MNVGSLFTGIGGFDLGLERAGMRVVWQSESNAYRRAVLRKHWPDVPCYEDVRAVDGSAERVDLICGGFPCQDLSVAGRRQGLAGSRSGLFFEFARIADAVLPDGSWVLIENVPGLLSSNGGRDFAVVLATLAEFGFHDLAWRVLDSRYFGVPQRRRRVFILARRARGRRASEVLLEPESGGGDFEKGREVREAVAEPTESGAVTAKWRKGGGPAGDEAYNLTVAATLSRGSNPNSNAARRRREDDFNLVSPSPHPNGVRAPSGISRRVDRAMTFPAEAQSRGWPHRMFQSQRAKR